MKTIYADIQRDPQKVTLSDDQLSLIEQVKAGLERTAELNKQTTFQTLELGTTTNDGELPVRTIISTYPRSTSRRKNGSKASSVDMEIEDATGWKSLTDTKDLQRLPDVYFEHGFLGEFLNPTAIQEGETPWRVIAQEHQANFITALKERAEQQLVFARRNPKVIRDLKGMIFLTNDIQEGSRSFEDMVSIFEDRLTRIRKQERGGGKERES